MSIFKTELADMYSEYQEYQKRLQVKYPNRKETSSIGNLCEFLIYEYSPEDFPDYKHIESYSDEIGESCYSIFTWKGKYYRIPYSHRSHEGSSYWGDGSDIREVKPVVKEVRVWE